MVVPRGPRKGLTAAWHVPGLRTEPPPAPWSPERTYLTSEVTLRLERGESFWRLAWSGGSGPGVVPDGGIAVVDLSLGERGVLFVARLVLPGESRERWGLGDWREAAVADLARMVDFLEQPSLRPHALAWLQGGGLRFPAWIPLPAGVPYLRQVQDLVASEVVGPSLLRARILARDLAPLVAPGVWERLAAPREETEPSGVWLARLAGTTNHPRVADRALEAGGRATQALLPEEAGARVGARLPDLVLVLLVLALLSLGHLLTRGGAPEMRRPAAAWMVVVGAAMSAVAVHGAGVDLGFERLGWVWAAAGTLVLGESTRTRGGRLSGAAFLLALLCAVAGLFAQAAGPWGEWAALLAATGFGLLPLLALALLPRRPRSFPWTTAATLLGIAYAVCAGAPVAGGETRLLAAFVVTSLLALLVAARSGGERRRGGMRVGRVAALATALVAAALGASLWWTRVPLPANVSIENASWYASQASIDVRDGRPEEAAEAYLEALASLDWWRMQRGSAHLPARYPVKEARAALIGLVRARAAIAKRRVGSWALPTAEAAAIDGLLELPSEAWATALLGQPQPPEFAREKRELLRVVALGESHRRSASGVLVALRALGEPSLVDPVGLDRLGRLFVAPKPAVRLDGLFMLRVLAEEADLSLPEQRALWTFLGRDPDRLAGLIVDQVQMLVHPGLRPIEQARRWAFVRRFVHEVAPSTGAKLAEALARRVGEGTAMRPLLVELTCRVGDLPIALDRAGGGLPASAPAKEAAALALWREVRDLPRAQAWWRRIAYAIDALPAEGEHSNAWLARHTAQPPMTRAGWKEWFSVASLVEPEFGLALAAGMEGDLRELGEDELLEIVYPREGRTGSPPLTPDEVARRAWVLSLCVDDDVRAPVWCAPLDRLSPWSDEPVAMCAAWHRALAPLLGARRFRIRVARYADDEGEVRSLWDEVLDVGLEERAPVYQRLQAIDGGDEATAPVFRRSFQVTWEPDAGYRLDPRSADGIVVGPREVATYALPAHPGATSALAVFGDAATPDAWSIEPAPFLPRVFRPSPAPAEEVAPRTSTHQVLPIAVGVIVAVLGVLLLTSGKAPRRRRFAAGLLVAMGLAGLAAPSSDTWGLALAALGSFVLARSAGRGWAWIAPAAFFVATVIAAAGRNGWGNAALPEVLTAWKIAAVVGLPLLAGALWPTARRRVEWLLAYALLGLALHCTLPLGAHVLTVWAAGALFFLMDGALRGPVPTPASADRRRRRGTGRRRTR